MIAADIVAKLFSAKGATRERIVKAQGAAHRNKVEWSAVVATMTPAQRKTVEHAMK